MQWIRCVEWHTKERAKKNPPGETAGPLVRSRHDEEAHEPRTTNCIRSCMIPQGVLESAQPVARCLPVGSGATIKSVEAQGSQRTRTTNRCTREIAGCRVGCTTNCAATHTSAECLGETGLNSEIKTRGQRLAVQLVHTASSYTGPTLGSVYPQSALQHLPLFTPAFNSLPPQALPYQSPGCAAKQTDIPAHAHRSYRSSGKIQARQRLRRCAKAVAVNPSRLSPARTFHRCEVHQPTRTGASAREVVTWRGSVAGKGGER
jgi:hypothetical protein